jgi:hypothetical protein
MDYMTAIKAGNVDWLNAHRKQLPSSEILYKAAIESDNLISFKWLWNNFKLGEAEINYFISYALGNERYDLFNWLWERSSQEMFTIYGGIDSVKTLNWLESNGFELDCDRIDPFDVDGNLDNALDIIKWIQEHGCDISELIFEKAATFGAFDILEWGYENDYQFDDQVLTNAIYAKHFELAEYLLSIGLTLSPHVASTLTGDPESNGLDELIWLHDHGFKFTSNNLLSALLVFNIEIMDWLDDIGVELSEDDIQVGLEDTDETDPEELPTIIQWLIKHNYEIGPEWLKVLNQAKRDRSKA